MTIAKFRELVQRMQEQSQELQQRLEKESTKPVSALPEILDFKVQFCYYLFSAFDVYRVTACSCYLTLLVYSLDLQSSKNLDLLHSLLFTL
jgi:hypothetical protein